MRHSELPHAVPLAITDVLDYKDELCQRKEQQHVKQQQSKTAVKNVETFLGIRYLLNLFIFLGVHIPKNNKFLYVLWSFFYNLLMTIFVPISYSITVLNMSGDEMEMGNFLTSLQAALNDIACAAKIISMMFLLPKLLKCQPILQQLDKRCRTKEEQTIIMDFNSKGNRIVVLFASAYCSYTASACISALIFHRLLYNMYNPFIDSKTSTIHFYVAVLIEAILAHLIVCQQIANDSYPVVFVTILRTHFNILLKRIENLSSDVTKSLEENLEELKLCIIDHTHILQIYEIVASVISVTIFIQFTVTALTLCVTLVNIRIFATDFASIVASCFYIFAINVEVFPLCYSAQCLMDESNRLTYVIFHSNWVDQDKRYRKMLIFFIHRAQLIIKFTAGKLFPITLNCFLSIAKFSFSLYTFIEQMGLKEKFDN